MLTGYLEDGINPSTVVPLLRADEGISVTPPVTEFATLIPGGVALPEIIAPPVTSLTTFLDGHATPSPTATTAGKKTGDLGDADAAATRMMIFA